MASPSKGKGGKQDAQNWLHVYECVCVCVRCVCARMCMHVCTCVCLCSTQTSSRSVALYELENMPSSVGRFKTKHSYMKSLASSILMYGLEALFEPCSKLHILLSEQQSENRLS